MQPQPNFKGYEKAPAVTDNQTVRKQKYLKEG